MKIKIKRLTPTAVIPTKAYDHAAGIDIYSDEDWVLGKGEMHPFSTGIASELDIGYAAAIWDRSGMAMKRIHRLAGVIDSDYRGEWKILLINMSDKKYEVKKGDKIAQALIHFMPYVEIHEVAELEASVRGTSGFGSSG